MGLQLDVFRIVIGLAIATGLSSCGTTQRTQCEEIFNLVRQVNSSAEKIAATPEARPLDRETWLEIANLMDTTARQLETLPVEDLKLRENRDNLAIVYQIYGAAMSDAVKAREVKDLTALKAASDRASYAGKLQQEAVAKINAYCLDGSAN